LFVQDSRFFKFRIHAVAEFGAFVLPCAVD